ncbi:MAG: alpha-mannosidase [Verrucomicrobia bacterium]|nr:alpha-mannosidase [Verrucomicrobiota bacterium]
MKFKLYQSPARPDAHGLSDVHADAWRQINSFPWVWGRLFQQCWFRLEYETPAASDDLWMQWNDQAEATLHHENLPWYGVDPAHRRAPLPKGAAVLHVESVCVQTGIWIAGATGIGTGGSHFTGIQFFNRDALAWETYHDLAVLLDILRAEYRAFCGEELGHVDQNTRNPLIKISPLFRRLQTRLDKAVDAFDRHGISAMSTILKEIYRDFPAAPHSLEAILTGHAHIDLVWLWPERVGEFKAVHTFATMNRLLKSYPEFRFGYSQPASYEAVGKRAPKLLEAVKDHIAAGQWEATGATYVESDTQLACGEALARSFVLGQKGFAHLRGTISKVLWIPDVFGYAPCLPQLMLATGCEAFFTTKLTWSAVNRFPYSSFNWRGHDGSEVLVHLTQAYGYNGTVDINDLRKGADFHQQAGVHDEFLVPTGYGDGGGGVTENMLERARRFASITGAPQTRWGTIEGFFERLQPLRPQLPTWQGELFLEYHRGVHTTHGELKYNFRKLEASLQMWEAAKAVIGGGAIPEKFWKRLVFAQFHDYIPGSSIAEVYLEANHELSSLRSEALREASQCLKSSGLESTDCLFNPLAVEITLADESAGKIAQLPAFSGTPTTALAWNAPQQPVTASHHSLNSGRVTLQLNDKGELAHLIIDGEQILCSAPLNSLLIYPDQPHNYAAWEIDRQALSLPSQPIGDARIEAIKGSHLKQTLRVHYQLTSKSTGFVDYILEADKPYVRIEYTLHWNDEDMLLKAWFPTGYTGRFARFGAPFGSSLRQVQSGDPRAEAMWEVPFSRWLTVSDDAHREGMFLVTEAKYGATVRDGSIGLSLLRSALMPRSDENNDIRDLGTRPKHTDIGHHHIRIAIGKHCPDQTRSEYPAVLAESLFTAPLAYQGQSCALPVQGLNGPNSINITWVEPGRDQTFTVRINETAGRSGSAQLILTQDAELKAVDLLGRPTEKTIGDNGYFEFSPYELISIRVNPIKR